jgi:hypothetical protein
MVHGGLMLIRYQRLRTTLILIRLLVLGMVHGGLMLIRYQRLKDCPDPDPLASAWHGSRWFHADPIPTA